MKTKIRITTALILLLTMLAGASAGNAAITTYSSGISVQNLEGVSATVTLSYYNPDGTLAVNPPPQIIIAAYDAVIIFPLVDPPSGFDGSMVISSTQPLSAAARITASDGTNDLAFGAAYTGFSSGAGSNFLPILYNNNWGFNTYFSVQNVGAVATDISVSYSDSTSNSATGLQPGAAVKFDQTAESHATGWIGSGTVTSTASDIAIVGMVVKDDTAGREAMMAYNGFPSGSQEPIFPTFYENNWDYMAGISIQNMGTNTTTLTVDYTASTIGGTTYGTDCTEVRNVGPNKTGFFGLYVFASDPDPDPDSLVSETCVEGEHFIGSGVVTNNSTSQELAAAINLVKFATPYKSGTYNGLDPSQGTAIVAFPMAMDRYGGYFSGFSIVNVGTSTIPMANMACVFRGIDKDSNPVVVTLQPSEDILVNGIWSTAHDGDIADGFIGSAICTATGGEIVGQGSYANVVANGDALYAYEGFNK